MGKKKVSYILCDTNILFHYLKGDIKTKSYLDKIGNERIAFSVITTAEAFAGSSRLDFELFKKVFSVHTIYPINEETSGIFNGLIRTNHNRHSKWIPDALIAATAMANNLELFTYNRKDFDFITGLKLYNPK